MLRYFVLFEDFLSLFEHFPSLLDIFSLFLKTFEDNIVAVNGRNKACSLLAVL